MMVCGTSVAIAQQSFQLQLKNSEDKTIPAGASATIVSLNKTVMADSSGVVTFINLPEGKYLVKITHAGLQEQEVLVTLPVLSNEPIEVLLAPEDEEEVIVSATRTSRSIADIPTRVETISGEELAEKGNMKPGEIRMLLNETTGIQAQQTSATSNNSSIRIQGLDGRYTQILKDGFPLYAGFSGGLSLMQVTPLDLKQVEVIKGSSSTLYGGGAIAGLINLVSKVPVAKKEISFLANGTSAGGLDLSAFYSEKFKKIGMTVFGSRNSSRPYDPADIGLTAIPEFTRYSINPRLFVYGEKTTANIGVNYITEKRTGGSMDYIKHGAPGYFEKNNTDRFTTQLDILHHLSENSVLNFKTSFSDFRRTINIPNYMFEGKQRSSYSEINYSMNQKKLFWIAGANFLTDIFKETPHVAAMLRNYDYKTAGAFVQNTWNPSPGFSLETGLRSDYTKQYGFSLLPRISAMIKASPKLTLRLGGGLGYKTPTVFTEDAEKDHFRNILPINDQVVENERSAGGNFDINFRTRIGGVAIAINQLFFYTQLKKPLVLTPTSGGQSAFVNAEGHIDTRGWETNLRFTYQDFKLFVGYTYADVNTHYNGNKSWFPLTARHRLNNVLIYEIEHRFKIGLEAYYFSPQKLNDNARGKSYWLTGAMAEKLWKKFSLFVNFENIFDTRQTKFDTIYTGNIGSPVFRDIYAPVDGFVVNGGLKIRL